MKFIVIGFIAILVVLFFYNNVKNKQAAAEK